MNASDAAQALGAGTGVLSYPLADGDAGVEQTLRHIRALVEAGKKHPVVRNYAVRALQAADPAKQHAFDDAFRARTLFHAVQRDFLYVPDPSEKEMLQPPAYMIEQSKAGDCDDFSVLLAALLGSVGIAVRLVTIATYPDASDFTHIYPEAWIGGRWVPMDAARRGAAFARQPGAHHRRRVWDLSSGNFQDVRGLAGMGGYRRERGALGAVPRTITMRRRGRRYPVYAAAPQLGAMGFDWGALTNLINVGTQSAASLIAATKGGGGQMFLPQATAAAPYAAPQSDYTIPLLIGGGLLLLAMRRQ